MLRSRQRRKKFHLNKKFLGVGLLVLVILIAWIVSKYFIIKSVQVKLNNVNCVDDQGIRGALGIGGENILFINFSDLENRLKSKYICIKSVEFTKQLPGNVLVNVDGRAAVAVIRTIYTEATTSASLDLSTPESSTSATTSAQLTFPSGDKGSLFLVDDEGVIFSQDNRTNLPILLISGVDLNIGKSVKDDLVKKAVQILQKIKDFKLDITQAIIYPNNTMLVDSKPKLQFNMQRDINVQLASLQLILDKAKIDNEKMLFLDLRFDKVVVKFAPKEKK